MEIYNNYSIGKVYSMLEYENRTPEILYLNDVITEYISETRKRVADALKQLPTGTRADVMKWISQNVDADIQYYVRCEYLNEPYNVLRKKNGSWKRAADIGVIVLERESQKEVRDNEWMATLKRKAAEISENPLRVFESHAHYDLKQYNGIRNELMELLHDTGVEKCIIPAIEFDDVKKCMELFDKPECAWIYYAVGSHPKYIWKERELWDDIRWQDFRQMLKNSKCCAVGEIGLDYSYESFCEADREFQKEMFNNFIEEANKAKLPIILHIRQAEGAMNRIVDAHKDAIEILSKNPIEYGAVLHCFGGDVTLMEQYMDVGVSYFGICGRISYMLRELDDAVINMPDRSILLETDSPYIRFQGDRMPNTSLTLYDVAERIARMKGVTVKQITEVAAENFSRLFHIEIKE